MILGVGIVGCGLIGSRRARVAVEAGDRVTVVADIDETRASAVAEETGGGVCADWREVVTAPDVDVVVVATYNALAPPMVLAALQAGKHVLCEKPLGTTAEEARAMRDAAHANGLVLKVGFNHRHHHAIMRGRELVARGAIGPVLGIRAAYGHGGRAGYETEWRADRGRSGGGELLDQGVHLVDLCRWFMGEFTEVGGMLDTAYWEIAPLEDNAYALLRTADGRVAALHTSWTQWRNLFRFEVIGRDGYLLVNGLGGSYGVETLTHGVRDAIPPTETTTEFPEPDPSWVAEWAELRAALAEGRQPLGNGDDGYEATRLIEAIYRAAAERAVVPLGRAA